MSLPLHIDEHTVGGVVVLQLEGHLVFDEGDRVLRDRIRELVQSGVRNVLIDLNAVSYVDSGGIGALVEMYMHLKRNGGQLKLLRPSPCATRVLDITHLATVFEIFEDEEHALHPVVPAPVIAADRVNSVRPR
jgi:anti-sigma B factor antagonist